MVLTIDFDNGDAEEEGGGGGGDFANDGDDDDDSAGTMMATGTTATTPKNHDHERVFLPQCTAFRVRDFGLQGPRETSNSASAILKALDLNS